MSGDDNDEEGFRFPTETNELARPHNHLYRDIYNKLLPTQRDLLEETLRKNTSVPRHVTVRLLFEENTNLLYILNKIINWSYFGYGLEPVQGVGELISKLNNLIVDKPIVESQAFPPKKKSYDYIFSLFKTNKPDEVPKLRQVGGSRRKSKRRRVKSTHRRHRRNKKSTRRHRRKY